MMDERSIDRRAFLRHAGAAAAAAAFAGCSGLPGARPGYPQAGPLVMIDLPGPELDAVSAGFIRGNDVRAVVLFGKNIVDSAQTQRLVARLRDVMGPAALIAVDQEGGAVVRTSDLPYPPSAMCLGAARNADLAGAVGAAVGRGLASLGINWNFAPSLDVNNNPLNPVISDRSFGSDPALVAELGLAWAAGCQSAGVATCVKHFPGHGDTAVDSHYGLPTVEKPEAALEALELLPFKAAVEAGMPCFMTSHIVFPAFDPERPATLSPRILTDLLRAKWGYDGVVVTDSMSMQAIADHYGRGESAVLALEAGADLVIAMGDLKAQQDTVVGIAAALKKNALTAPARQARMERLTRLASRFPSRFHPYPAAQRQADASLMQQAWAAGLTPYGGPQPVAPGAPVTLVVAEGAAGGGASDRGMSGPALAERLRAAYDLRVVFYPQAAPLAALDRFRNEHTSGRTVLFASTGRARPGGPLRALIDAVAPDLHLALWNPYTVLDVPSPALITYGFRPEALDAAAAWLQGRIPAPGQLPITLEKIQ